MARISLSNGLETVVDDDVHADLAGYRWHAHARDAANGGYYAFRYAEGRKIYMHREIIGAIAGQTVDHVDGDGLNNARANLRLASISQNNANRAAPGSVSGYRGVERQTHGFRATIGRHPNLQRGRTRADPADAARDYDEMARARFGEFARTNF